jgi:RimJ/RimL family protein N-acetyltransferase
MIKLISDNLPVISHPLTIRNLCRADVDVLSNWKSYSPPYSAFDLSIANANESQKDEYFQKRLSNTNSFTFVIDYFSTKCVGYVLAIDVDIDSGIVGNFGMRINPKWCNKGIGTESFKQIISLFDKLSFRKLVLDVAQSNSRAIHVYDKLGFSITGTFTNQDTSFYWMTRELPKH